MIQKDKTHFYQTVSGIMLFEDDINEIISRLKRYSLTVVLQDKDNLYDSIDEVKQNKGVHPKVLKIDAEGKIDRDLKKFDRESASLDFQGKKVTIFFSGSERLQSFGYEIKDYLKDRSPLYLRLFNYNYVVILFWFGICFAILWVTQEHLFYKSLPFYILISFFAVLVCGAVFINMTTHGLNLAKRHEYGFWKRNKDKILLALIGALLGVLSTLFIQWILKK